MPRPIYVIGHKNSDLDAIASAYAYARLLRMQGEEQAIAARNGPLTPEVRFVLERFQVDPPEAMNDVYIHVRDVMRRDVICAYLDQTLLEALQLLQEHNRYVLPVVDAENKVHGIIAIEDFTKLLLNNRNLQAVSRVSPERDNLVQLTHLSASTQEIMNREFDACRPEDQLSEVQPKLRRRNSLPVVDAEGKLVGNLSYTDLFDARPKRVILVDLNEQSQVVDGIEEAELLEIIDHHYAANIHTNKPIMFRSEPVGCTATMIAGLYYEAGIAIPREVAGLLLAGVLRDTLILRSLFCTARDEQVAAELAKITGEQIEKFGQELFAAATSDANSCSAEALLTANLKEFTLNDVKVASSKVETASPATIEKRSEELLTTMQRLAQERSYTSFLYIIRDIINTRCTLLVYGGERALAAALDRPLEKDGHTVYLERLVGRKRYLLPLLARCNSGS